MADEYEITYKGKNYIVEADCSKSDDHYIGSNTFDIDIKSVKKLTVNILDEYEEEDVDLDDIDLNYLASELAYICADELRGEVY